jgi:integrase
VDRSTSTEQHQKSKSPNSLRRVSEGLYRNPTSGAYFAHFRLNGRVFKESLDTTELPVAKRKLRDLRQEKEHLDPNAGKQTLREITERHLKLQGNLSRSSITKKTGIANAVYQQWPKSIDRPALEIRASEVEEWLLTVTKGLRHSSRNEWLFFIKGVFERAVRDGILVKSPVAHLMPVKRQAVERLTPTWEQFQAMVCYIRNNTINRRCAASGDFVEFMGLSGLGNGEVAELKVRDVDLARGTIWVRRQKTDTGFHIPIFPRLRPLVERLVRAQGGDPNAKLVPISEAKHALESTCKALNYPHFTQRSLRRMFITDALEKGIDVKTIAEWQGHRDGGKLILDTYSHVRRPHHDRMAELLA